MMHYENFLAEVINRGIVGLCEHYPPEGDGKYSHHKNNREGGCAGFEACRGKQPAELLAIFSDARDKTQAAYWNENKDRYWWYRYFEIEVEWVCNVVSAALHNEGKPTIITPTGS